MSSSDVCHTARRGVRGPGDPRRLAALAILALTGGCGHGPAGEPPLLSSPEDTAVETPVELIARFPPDPADQTSAAVIEGALGLAVHAGGVHVLDAVGSRVLHFDHRARLLARSGRRGRGPGELQSPVGLAVDGNGAVWVGDPAAGRVTRFDRTGAGTEGYPSPYPPVNFTVAPSGDPIVFTMSAETLLATVTPDGVRDLDVSAELVPPEVSGGPRDRMSLKGLMLAPLGGGSVAMLQNRHGTDFRLWRIDLTPDASGIDAVTPLPLPGWLYTILDQETEAVRSTVPEEFAEGDFLIPFKGMHAVDGRLWLAPTPSSRLIALAVATRPGQPMTAVVGDESVYRGLIDASVAGDRLFALYDTELRVYRLGEKDGPFTP